MYTLCPARPGLTGRLLPISTAFERLLGSSTAIQANSLITTVAGDANSSFSGDNVPATAKTQSSLAARDVAFSRLAGR
jgi:hypothetical protein